MRKLLIAGAVVAGMASVPAYLVIYSPTGGTERRLSEKLAAVVSVLDYGAQCNSTNGSDGNDDTTAIAKAKAAATTSGAILLYDGPGTYCRNTAPGGRVHTGTFGVVKAAAVLTVAGVIEPVRPSPANPLTFPEGDDLKLQAAGSADVHIANSAIDITSTTSVGAPGVATVTVGTTAGLCVPAASCSIIVEPSSTTNMEVIASAKWNCTGGNCATGTQITATFAKAHTQPFTVRQVGGTFLDYGQALNLNYSMPSSEVDFNSSTSSTMMKFTQETSGDISQRFFHAGTQVGRYTPNGSTGMQWIAIAGVGTGGHVFEGQATGQRPLFDDVDNAADNNLIFRVDANLNEVRFGQSVAFASLGSTANALKYCSDCKNVIDDAATAGAACASGGHGAFARRENGHWACN